MLYIKLIQGTPLLILLFLTYFGLPALGLAVEPLVAAGARPHDLRVGVPRRDLARQPRVGAAHAGEAAECLALNWLQRMVARDPAAGGEDRHAADGRLHGADRQEHLARLGDRLRRAGARRPDDQQLDLPPFLVFMLIAALYFALCYPLSAWSRRLERKFDVAHR